MEDRRPGGGDPGGTEVAATAGTEAGGDRGAGGEDPGGMEVAAAAATEAGGTEDVGVGAGGDDGKPDAEGGEGEAGVVDESPKSKSTAVFP